MFLILLLACLHPTPVASPPCPVVEVSQPVPSEVVSLDAQITILLEGTEDADQQERLYALRELLINSGKMTIEDRQRVGRYAEQVLKIEARSLPMPMAEPEEKNPIEDVPIEDLLPIEPTPPDVLDPVPPAPTP